MRFKTLGTINELIWHRWFAWYPIFTGDEWIWLERVERKRDDMWEMCWIYRGVKR